MPRNTALPPQGSFPKSLPQRAGETGPERWAQVMFLQYTHPPSALPRPSSCSRCCPGDVRPQGHITLELHSSGDTQPWGRTETEHSINAARGWGPLSRAYKMSIEGSRLPPCPQTPLSTPSPGLSDITKTRRPLRARPRAGFFSHMG